MQDKVIAVPGNGKETRPGPSAELLRTVLREEHGVQADTHIGYGLALVAVWAGLVIWCDGEWYRWRAGWDDRRKRVLYARDPAVEPSRAARRIALRYAELRGSYERSAPTVGARS
ncbi:hypothetical protein ACFFV7_47925 [Nonomuraea spiralis]|uniref:Uncharacterized protein n=1 Tax=Nonomuraea spiralis TaxID=46182 RepID=A0ABV5IXJ6_9ACTN|nr:hypothetical protein [Nonomuraea spiralis]GGT31526.1 hypothetical protein GCM10010176_090240 [Nonomuraea spiralis]